MSDCAGGAFVESIMSRQNTVSGDNSALRRKAKRTIDQLSGLPLRLSAEFLSFVQERQAKAATRELLDTPGSPIPSRGAPRMCAPAG